MQDALLIYLIIANMRHAGYFRALAASVRHLQTAIAVSLSIATRICEAGMLPWVTAPSSHRAMGARPWTRRRELNQALTRLENYVATMA